MRERSGLVAVLLALSLGACQGPPPPAPQASPDAGAQAAEALAAGDHGRAADLYRLALAGEPESLPLRYGLAVANSHLGRREDTIREFRWVLARALEGSPEGAEARRWLRAAGALPPDPSPASPPDPTAPPPGAASLAGRALSGAPGEEPRPLARRMLILYGLPDGPTREERFQIRTDEEGRFRFANILPGPYMLTDAVAGPRTWRLRVQVPAGQETVLDLTPANGVATRDDFPDRPQASGPRGATDTR